MTASYLHRPHKLRSGPHRGKNCYILGENAGQAVVFIPDSIFQEVAVRLSGMRLSFSRMRRALQMSVFVDKFTLYSWLAPEHESVVIESRARGILDAWAAWLPIRIANEEIGDCLEDIARRACAGQRWSVYSRVVSAIFWSGVGALGYYYERVGRKKAG